LDEWGAEEMITLEEFADALSWAIIIVGTYRLLEFVL
jgi:hypothetical protein